MWNKIGIALLLVVLVGCKAKKEILPPVAKAPDVKIDTNKMEKLMAITKSQTDFQTISIKAKTDLTIDKNNYDVTMNIRIKKDEMIWISVTAIAGLEVARVVITPDSMKILNRLESTYTQKPFSFIHQFTNDQINFRTLQSILIGNTITEFVTNKSEVFLRGNQTLLSGVLKSLTANILFNEHHKVVQTNLVDSEASQNLDVNYADFTEISGRKIPHSILIKSQADKKNIQINLQFTRVSLDESLDFPFNVPKRFSVEN